MLWPMNTPIEITEFSSTIRPSTISERAPMKQSSSMMVEFACSGSSTPPMPTPQVTIFTGGTPHLAFGRPLPMGEGFFILIIDMFHRVDENWKAAFLRVSAALRPLSVAMGISGARGAIWVSLSATRHSGSVRSHAQFPACPPDSWHQKEHPL